MLVATDVKLYDKFGKYIGRKVEDVDAYTAAALIPFQCTECGLANGAHQEYFIKTGQDGAGSVDGFYQMCSRAKEKGTK